MSDTVKSLLNLLMKEALFLYALPLVFITIYIVKYHFNLQSGISHIGVITFFGTTIICFKALLFQSLKSKREAVLLTSAVYGIFFYLLIIYYALVIMSLASWGKVITSELLISYFVNARQFCQSIDISFALVIVVLALGLVVTTLLCHFALKSLFVNDYPFNLSVKIKPKLMSVFIFMLFLLNYYTLIDRVLSPDLSSHEPINLTLYSGKNYLDNRFYPRLLPYNNEYNTQETLVRKEYQPNQNAHKLNIILIFIDALRLTNLQVYGYHRETTPFLNSLYQEGKLKTVKQAYASCPETSCALSSFLTSRFPHQLPEHPFTFVDVLKKHGYRTMMTLGGDHTNFYSLRELYGDLDEYYDGSMEKKYFFNDDGLVINKLSTLSDWNKQPAFLQFHLMSAHTLGKHHESFKKFTPSKNYVGHLQGPVNKIYINHYDNGVLQADNYIKHLFTMLEEKKYLQNSIVIITADHGELLGEHGLYTHANGVWEDLLHIPLLIISPNNQDIVNIPNDKLVSQVDVAPTILQALNMPIPQTWTGGEEKNTGSYLYFRWPPQSGLYDPSTSGETWKYWLNYNTGEEFIFNINKDPKEEHNLVWDPKLQKRKKTWREALNKNQSLNAVEQ